MVGLATSASAQQQSDIDAVEAAVAAYHAALGSLDIPKMEPLWAHDANVMLINPRQADGPHVGVKGDMAWSTGIANAVVKMKTGETINAPTYETDVFEKRGNQWLLLLHTASRVPQ